MKTPKKTSKFSRRGLLKTGAGLALGGVLGVRVEPADSGEKPVSKSVYEAIGVKHVINATGTLTTLGGSLMPPEVVAAWVDASRHFVDLFDLQDKVGRRIAKLIGVEAALVTTGAAGAMLLGTAAAVTGKDPKRIQRLPDTLGLKDVVIMQKSHHTCYDNQMRNVGVRLIDVESAADVRRAVSENTALMFFLNLAEPDGQIKREEWIALARRHKVPTLLDAAADVPPVENLAAYNKLGFDMVAFSGGKGLLGPNDTGLLLGRASLIEAAKLNNNPHCGNIGRMMKVSKEDMIALLAAVERYLRTDHKGEWAEWERRLAVIEETLKDIPTLQSERFVPPIANHVPHLILTWNEKRIQLTRDQVTQKLAQGDPPIQLGRVRGTGDRGLLLSVFMLKNGEDRIVADRLHLILKQAGQQR